MMSGRSDSNLSSGRLASNSAVDSLKYAGIGSSLRPPLKPMTHNNSNASKYPLPSSNTLKRGNSKITGYFEQLSINSNQHSSTYEESQPHISAANLIQSQ